MKFGARHLKWSCVYLPCAIVVYSSGYAAEIDVTVLDREAEPVAGVVVYAEREGDAMSEDGTPRRAVMDQRDGNFVPHILVVDTGTEIVFPNTDTVSHHVYSFSEAHPFELPLYRGQAYPPQKFDKSGLIVLGCNIHDNMLGYILVVDTPSFAMTGPDGRVTLGNLASGDYVVRIWTPRARPRDLPAESRLALDDTGAAQLQFQLREKLFPPHESAASSLTWAYH